MKKALGIFLIALPFVPLPWGFVQKVQEQGLWYTVFGLFVILIFFTILAVIFGIGYYLLQD